MKTKLEQWPQLKDKRPLIIAGPCSAETEEQLVNTAKQLATDKRIHLLRAGIWKPRTRPGSFEGVGSIGLEWLNTAKKETGLPTAVEVANVKHVYAALKSGVDVLWIGARTSANPFAVQEIADALEGVDIPVLVKNPINPDVALWVGALERLEKKGITRLGAIHRGVSQFGKSAFRNKPEWQMAIQLRELLPEILMINDPSHITGNKELVFTVAQKALDLKFDGLMIESHIDPSNAWSDAAQQVTPALLSTILDRLVLKVENPEGVETESLEELRNIINHIDDQVLELLSYRFNVAREIATYKHRNQMTIFQENRWNQLLKQLIENAENKGLREKFTSTLYHLIHQESIDIQSEFKENPIVKK